MVSTETATEVPAVHFGIGFIGQKIWVVPWKKIGDDLIHRPVGPGHQLTQGKTDGSISAGGSGTISVYADETDTGVNVTAYAGPEVGETIASGTWVRLAWCAKNLDGNGQWEIVGYKCA